MRPFLYCFLDNRISYIMLLIIRKSKRANPPAGICAVLIENFPLLVCVKHAAEMKAELRGEDIKGEHVGRTIQSGMCCFSFAIPL